MCNLWEFFWILQSGSYKVDGAFWLYRKDKAGKEIEAHLASGGNFDEIMEDINRAVEESGFFRALKA